MHKWVPRVFQHLQDVHLPPIRCGARQRIAAVCRRSPPRHIAQTLSATGAILQATRPIDRDGTHRLVAYLLDLTEAASRAFFGLDHPLL